MIISAKIRIISETNKKKHENFLRARMWTLNYNNKDWLSASAKGEDDDLTGGAEAEGDKAAEACGDEEGLGAFGVPVVELFAQ